MCLAGGGSFGLTTALVFHKIYFHNPIVYLPISNISKFWRVLTIHDRFVVLSTFCTRLSSRHRGLIVYTYY